MWITIICGFVCALVVLFYHEQISVLDYTQKMIKKDLMVVNERYRTLLSRHLALLEYLNIEYCEREVKDEKYLSGYCIKPSFRKLKVVNK